MKCVRSNLSKAPKMPKMPHMRNGQLRARTGTFDPFCNPIHKVKPPTGPPGVRY